MMSLLSPEQITAAQKANLDTLFGLTNKAFEGFEKLLQLNFETVKSTFAELQENAQKALSVKDPQELLGLQASPMQPFTEKVLSYGRHVYEIASSTQAEFAKVAEARYEAQSRRVQTLVDDIAKSAPTGSEAAVAVMRSAIAAANTAYETVHKATQQAVEMAESNLEAAVTAASKGARQGAEQTARAARK
jgi:phasin family protein